MGEGVVFVREARRWGTRVALLSCLAFVAATLTPLAAPLSAAPAIVPRGAAPASVAQGLPLAVKALQQAEFWPSEIAGNDYFGQSVAISGNTAVVGAYQHDTGGMGDSGAAYVFVRSGATWTEQQELTADDPGANDHFGWSVAVSGDTVVVGAPNHTYGGSSFCGAAYVFTRSGVNWTQKAELNGGAFDDELGSSVALSGNTALAGVPYYDNGTKKDTGAVYAYTRSGTTWSAPDVLVADDGVASDYFGANGGVALSGNTALIGSSNHSSATIDTLGAAYIFTRSGTTWSQRAELTPADGAKADYFGGSVAISGGTALVGAMFHTTTGGTWGGAAYVFTGSGAAWTKQAEWEGAADMDYLGSSVALTGDTALVGAPYQTVETKTLVGAVDVYTRSGIKWTRQPDLSASDGVADDDFGGAVAISGSTALVGAKWHDVGLMDAAGAAYVYQFPPPKPVISKLRPTSGRRGALVNVSGTGFGTKQGTSYVKFGAAKCTKYAFWSSTRIKCRVPAKAKFGKQKVTVRTAGGTSGARSFRVRRVRR